MTEPIRRREVHYVFDLSRVAAHAELRREIAISRKAIIVVISLRSLVSIWLWFLLYMFNRWLLEARWRLDLSSRGARSLGRGRVRKWVCASPKSVLADASEAGHFDVLLKLTLPLKHILQAIIIVSICRSILRVFPCSIMLRRCNFLVFIRLRSLVLFKRLKPFVGLDKDWTWCGLRLIYSVQGIILNFLFNLIFDLILCLSRIKNSLR